MMRAVIKNIVEILLFQRHLFPIRHAIQLVSGSYFMLY